MSMQDRLSLIGGPAYLNINAAMTIGGFNSPAEIYRAISQGEIDVNEKTLIDNDPQHERSWVLIEKKSFLQWLERRAQVDIRRLDGSLRRIRAWLRSLGYCLQRIEAACRRGNEWHQSQAGELGQLRAQQAGIERHLASLRRENAELKILLIENLRADLTTLQLKRKHRAI